MRFSIEQRHLTDTNGRPISGGHIPVSFHTCEAEDATDAVRLFMSDHKAEIIGTVVEFPGFQAVATLRSPQGVFTLQVAPSSQQMRR